MASLKEFLGHRRLDQITLGDLDHFKTWRRENDIKEVTIRHDAGPKSIVPVRATSWVVSP